MFDASHAWLSATRTDDWQLVKRRCLVMLLNLLNTLRAVNVIIGIVWMNYNKIPSTLDQVMTMESASIP